MDYTSILNMHQELSLITIFLLVFVMDLFLPEKYRYLIRRLVCILFHNSHMLHILDLYQRLLYHRMMYILVFSYYHLI